MNNLHVDALLRMTLETTSLGCFSLAQPLVYLTGENRWKCNLFIYGKKEISNGPDSMTPLPISRTQHHQRVAASHRRRDPLSHNPHRHRKFLYQS